MPLFGNKFSPKKGAPRKSPSLSNLNLDASERQVQFGLDYGPIKLKLGPNEMVFDNGLWIPEGSGGGPSQRDVFKLKKQNQQLSEENNLLKVKIEVLLDMLAQSTAEVHLQENEIEQLKKLAKRKVPNH